MDLSVNRYAVDMSLDWRGARGEGERQGTHMLASIVSNCMSQRNDSFVSLIKVTGLSPRMT